MCPAIRSCHREAFSTNANAGFVNIAARVFEDCVRFSFKLLGADLYIVALSVNEFSISSQVFIHPFICASLISTYALYSANFIISFECLPKSTCEPHFYDFCLGA